MNRKLKFAFCMAVFLMAFKIISTPVELPEEVNNALIEENEFVHYFYKNEKPLYIPDTTLSSRVQAVYEDLPITIGVEVFFKIKAPDSFTNSEEDHLNLYNILHSISKLKGIEYYSVRRKRMRIFFKQAYMIDSIESEEELADPIFNKIPLEDKRMIFQEDSTFGKNVSEAAYTYLDGIYSMTITNKTVMKYFIPVVDVDGSIITLQIIPTVNEILFYGVIGVDTVSLFGLEKAKKESFYNRLKAMYNWFVSELEFQYKYK